MRRQFGSALLAICLAACAGNSARTATIHPISKSYVVDRPRQQIVECMQTRMPGLLLELGQPSWTMSFRNVWGTNLIVWYLSEVPEGTKVEVRRAQKIAGGIKQAEECFL